MQWTRMHSSRMRTAHWLPYRGVSVQEGLSRETPHTETPRTGILRSYDLWCMLGQWPHPLWTESQTDVKTLPYPKFRLQAVKITLYRTKNEWSFCLPQCQTLGRHYKLSNYKVKMCIVRIWCKQPQLEPHKCLKLITGMARLIRSHSSARFCFELSGNSN